MRVIIYHGVILSSLIMPVNMEQITWQQRVIKVQHDHRRRQISSKCGHGPLAKKEDLTTGDIADKTHPAPNSDVVEGVWERWLPKEKRAQVLTWKI